MKPLKIKTSIISLMSLIVILIVGTVMYFQYKSSNEFALLTTQKVFDKVSIKVINQIENYDSHSIGFINLSKDMKHIDDKPVILENHTILPIIRNYITNANYVYGIYLGFKNENFYIVYNLDLSPKMRVAQKAPKKARWLIKKNIHKNNKFISFKEFVDKDFNTISTTEEATTYQPTKRPWYIDATTHRSVIKTKPYIFSSVGEPGVTYAKEITSDGTVLCLDITLSSLNKLLSSQNLVQGSAAFIFKEDGKPVAQFDQISNKKIENLNQEYPDTFISNGKVIDLEEQKIVTINGVEYLKYTTQLKSNFKSQDYLTILSPMDVVMKPYNDKIYEVLGITALVLLLFIMPLIIYSISLLVKPILQLGRENKKVEEGRFDDVEEVDSFMIEINGLSHSLVSMARSIEESQRTLESKVEMRTVDLNVAKKEIEATHKHMRESIEYAALIQSAVLPDNNNMRKYFKDQFTIWHPKDTVGGDIYFFEELRHEDECLLFFIDCTGHGVPGAFVTMLVKAVEQQIIAEIMNDETNMDISPAWIMAYFNRELKKLLKQEDKSSISNAGWDGGVIYYNKKDQIIKFAGAETPLFYTTKDGELKTIKGNRYSVGYKKCAMDYVYKETILEVEEGMKFYCTTDGYLDQNGGSKDFPFGKKRFGNIIKEYHTESMADQQEMFLYEMEEYESQILNNDRNDDMTVIGFEIGKQSTSDDILLQYSGVFTQNIISNYISELENTIVNIGEQSKISTLVIELTQNIMNYSKVTDENSQISQVGSIEVLKTHEGKYLINSKNIISSEDKNILEPVLKDIQTLNNDEIRLRYRELRRSGEKTHAKGGGIGFYEIAKLISSIEYSFIDTDNNDFIFELKCVSKG